MKTVSGAGSNAGLHRLADPVEAGPAASSRERRVRVFNDPDSRREKFVLTWAGSENMHYRGTVWGELVRFLTKGTDSRLYIELAKNVLVWAGPNRLVAAGLVCACAAAAYVVSLRRA